MQLLSSIEQTFSRDAVIEMGSLISMGMMESQNNCSSSYPQKLGKWGCYKKRLY